MASTISAGTTSTTALVYTADTSGVLQLQTNGTTTAVTIDTSQRVGIGTSSPSGILHTYATNGVNYFESPGISSVALQFKTNSTNRYLIGVPSASADLQFLAGGSTETMRLTSAGNLGIGTSSPGRQLQVSNSSNAIISAINTSGPETVINAVTTAGNVGTANSYPLTISTNGTQALYIDTSQNVGIGTTSPNKTGYTSPVLSITNGTSGIVELVGTQTADGTIGQVAFYNTSSSIRVGQILGLRSGANNSGAIAFQTNNAGTLSEVGRFDNSGNLLVGQSSLNTSGTGFIFSPNYNSIAGDALLWIGNSQSTSAYTTYNLYSSGASAYRFYVDMAGTIHATSGTIAGVSDATLKTNVKNLETGLAEINKLQPRRFDWINGDGTNVAGFISQEVQTVLPDLVAENLYSHNEDGSNVNKLFLQMGDMMPTVVKAIQELSAQVTTLQSQVAALKA